MPSHSPASLLVLALLFAIVGFPLCSQAILYGKEANHSLEECVCCRATPECLTNVGPGAGFVGTTDKTHQHFQFETLQSELSNEPCTVEGYFPEWAAGSMFKNGFGKFESRKAHYEFLSVFDAMGYTAKITIHRDGTVRTTAKLTKNDWYNRSEGLNGYQPHNPPYRTFMGTDPELSFFEKIRLLFTIVPDNLNVNIVRQGKRLFGISDMDGFNEIDPHSMEYLDYFRYSDRLSMTSSILSLMGVMTSAHPVFRASNPHIIYNFVAVPGGYLMHAALFPMAGTMLILGTTFMMLKNRLGSASSASSSRVVTTAFVLMMTVSSIRWSFQAIDGQIDNVEVNKYILYKLDTSKEPLTRESVIEFRNKRFSYLHEMAITQNHVIFAEWPTFWNIGSITNPFFNDPAKLTLTWDASKGTKLTVVDTSRGQIVSEHNDLGAYWSYHHIGAYEDKGNIMMDACTFDSGEHLHTFETRTLKKNSFSIPRNINRRFVIPLGRPNEPIRVKNVGPVGFDLPTRNTEYVGRKYRYAYGTGHRNEGEWWNTIVKVDMNNGKTIQWYESHTWPSQPVFVPNPQRKSEDQGLLLILMLDGKSQRSFLLALDAETFQEVARAWIPVMLPYTSHGYFDVEYGGDRTSTIIPGVNNGFRVE